MYVVIAPPLNSALQTQRINDLRTFATRVRRSRTGSTWKSLTYNDPEETLTEKHATHLATAAANGTQSDVTLVRRPARARPARCRRRPAKVGSSRRGSAGGRPRADRDRSREQRRHARRGPWPARRARSAPSASWSPRSRTRACPGSPSSACRSATSCRRPRSCARACSLAAAIALAVALLTGVLVARALTVRVLRLERTAQRVAAGRLRRPLQRLLGRRARTAGRGARAHAEPARGPRGVAPALHRDRLARAAHADLLARRLPRADPGRGPRRRDAPPVRRPGARAGRASRQARHAAARPLAPRVRVGPARAGADGPRRAGARGQRRVRPRARPAPVAARPARARGAGARDLRPRARRPAAADPDRQRADPHRGRHRPCRSRSRRRTATPARACRSTTRAPASPTEALERIFEPFYSADGARGAGLGLAIAHELSVQMGARLEVASAPGDTTFTLLLAHGRCLSGASCARRLTRPAAPASIAAAMSSDILTRASAGAGLRRLEVSRGASPADERRRSPGSSWSPTAGRSPTAPTARSSAAPAASSPRSSGLASYRELIWIASAMTEEDAAVSHRHGGRAFDVSSPAGGDYRVRLVESSPEAYDRFYNIFANPMLWFIQHYLWDLSNAPDIRRNEIEAFEFGYNVVNEDLARAVVEEIEDVSEPGRDGARLPPLHAPGARPPRPPRRLPAPLRPHPVDAAGRLARAADADPPGALRGAARQRHHRLPHAVLPAQLPAVLPRADRRRDRLRPQHRDLGGPRGLGPRVPAADRPRRHARRRQAAARRAVRGGAAAPPARLHDPARRPRRPLEERAARLLGVRHLPRAASRVHRARDVRRAADAVAHRRARSTRSTSSGSRRWSRSSTTATARPTGCRSSSSCATTSRRPTPPTSSTTCCSSTRCSTA